MASGSSGRNNNPASKGFDFGSDDILCSYDDNYSNQDASNTHVDKEFHKSRMARSSVIPAGSYNSPEDNFNQDVISTVEKTMKKHAENLMRFLEGISSRLSQLELYCYNLDKSIGEMRSDLTCDHGETDTKLKSLEKHLQEVHRSVQILRDKQELAETQKELAKLQLAQKDSSPTSHAQQNEEQAVPHASDPKKADNSSDVHGQQLALALPHQIPQQPVFHTRPSKQQQLQPMTPSPPQPQSVPLQSISQSQGYFLPPPHMPNTPAPGQQIPGQYLPSDSQYSPASAPQMQDLSRVVPQPTQSQVNQAPQVQPLPQYQQQWPQQVPQQAQPLQQPSMQSQIRPSSTAVYTPYLPGQPSSQETLPGSMPMQVPFSGVSQSGVTRAETMPYGYGGTGRQVQMQPPLQHVKGPFGTQQGDGYAVAGQQPSLSLGNAYMIYGEGGRAHHSPPQPHFPQGVYPPNNVPLHNPQPSTIRPQLTCSNPYNELIDKLVSMGYRGDHVMCVIHTLEESGQPVDFNTVLDRLNGQSSGGSQRGWSG